MKCTKNESIVQAHIYLMTILHVCEHIVFCEDTHRSKKPRDKVKGKTGYVKGTVVSNRSIIKPLAHFSRTSSCCNKLLPLAKHCSVGKPSNELI